jgi:hypothetical protein
VTEILALKFLHLLAFVYWLGGDLGTFFASRFVTRDDLSPETRAIALKIMLGCDQGPKTCMPLIFPLGLQLGQSMGITSLPVPAMLLVWTVALAWSVNVQYLYFSDNETGKARVTAFDFWLRVAVAVAVAASAVGALVSGAWITADWFAWKMLIFAGLVCCGLMIRVKLRPFVVAFGQLLTAGPSADINRTLAATLAKVRPYVYTIWAGLLLNAAIGLHLL